MVSKNSFIASQTGNLTQVKFAIQNGANVNAIDDSNYTALIFGKN